MEVYSSTRALVAGKLPLSLLLATLSAAFATTLISADLIAPEARAPGNPIAAAKQAIAAAASDIDSPRASSEQPKAAPRPDERPAAAPYILHGLAGHPLPVFK
ncbi:MAG TPA: hypothetical protein VE397_13790 [Stellaceae bacterium]|nr:hypothetical protein [Stellaceae bacterium]